MNRNFAAIVLGGTGQVGGATVAELLSIRPKFLQQAFEPEAFGKNTGFA